MSVPICNLKSSKLRFFSMVLILLVIAATSMLAVEAEQASYENSTQQVGLDNVASHPEEFKDCIIITNGTVRFYASIYMFEDFWLQTTNGLKIPAVTRSAGLPTPPNGSLIETTGTIQYSNLEGGFYFLNVSSWKPLETTPAATSTATATPNPTFLNTPPFLSPSPITNETPSPTLSSTSLPALTQSPKPQLTNQLNTPSGTPYAETQQPKEQNAPTKSSPLEYELLVVLAAIAAGTTVAYLLIRKSRA